ncbi:hypothetical protein ACA910_006368 [Epithemia clementina (nom. ined.)]
MADGNHQPYNTIRCRSCCCCYAIIKDLGMVFSVLSFVILSVCPFTSGFEIIGFCPRRTAPPPRRALQRSSALVVVQAFSRGHNVAEKRTTRPTSSASLDSDGREIIPSHGSFPDTDTGAISIVSMNVLAPSYHALERPEEKRQEWATVDRQTRYPNAIVAAKRKNANVLCLQEVEGVAHGINEELRAILQREEDNEGGALVRGYDEHVWSPLLPNSSNDKNQDFVGLCVAWRSDRHRLVSCETFRRGMVVQLAEIATGATIALANLHLPAKPSAIEGRLRTMASAVRRLQTCEAVVSSSSRKRQSAASSSPLNGLTLVVGDFNCDHNSPSVKFLKTGYSLYGTIRDRNYKAKISKKVASNMKHIFRFRDVYDEIRYDIAPITVSLKGRGPGCMDHILYSAHGAEKGTGSTITKTSLLYSLSSSVTSTTGLQGSGKRQFRRERGVNRNSIASTHHPERENFAQVRLASVLATVQATDKARLRVIENGLPNEQAGFYSDHLPVGALFESYDSKNELSQDGEEMRSSLGSQYNRGRVLVQERRGAYQSSLATRSRHNKVLRCMAEWLLEVGHAKEMIRDVPLYKWKWITNDLRLTKKMRAPDLCCSVGEGTNGDGAGGTLIIVEVTVVGRDKNASSVYAEKVSKYQDVLNALSLSMSDAMKVSGISRVASKTTALVLDESGQLYDQSRQDLLHLTRLCVPEANAEEVCNQLCQDFRELLLVQTP